MILYDRLIPDGALVGARADAELRYVGKQPGAAALAQEDLNRLLVELGEAGKRVVRLKGGDPFVFGRGGEEAEALAAAGVPFEVVPGVTAGVAAPAYAGIPVTHRDAASAVAFVTGHEDPDKPETALDWEALARFPGTLVLYMGVKNLPLIAERLTAAGRDPDESAAVVERGTYPDQRTVTAPLSSIAEVVARERIRPPAITLIGPVASLRETIAWLERRPLHGEVVAVTRARAQSSGLAARLRELGARGDRDPGHPHRAAQARARRSRRLRPDLLHQPQRRAALLRGARERRPRAGRRHRRSHRARAPPTSWRAWGIRADVVPERFVAEGLLKALEDIELRGRKVLVPRAAEARDVLPEGLRERGAEVDVLPLYDTVAEPLSEAARAGLARATYVTFTSSSTVRFFLEGGGVVPEGARVVSIGPVTSATAHELGLKVDVEAERHDPDGLVEALTADAAARKVSPA